MNVVPQKICKKKYDEYQSFHPRHQVEEDDDHQSCHTLFSLAPGLSRLIAVAAPTSFAPSLLGLIDAAPIRDKSEALGVVVGAIVDSAAAVVGGAQREVCTRTTSHHWIQLRFSQYETWRCLGVILSIAWRCGMRSSFTLNECPHLFTPVTFAACCNVGWSVCEHIHLFACFF